MALADKTMQRANRGCSITLSGRLLPEVLDALVRAHGYSSWNEKVRTTSKDLWQQEVRDLNDVMLKVWNLALKAQRRRSRSRKSAKISL